MEKKAIHFKMLNMFSKIILRYSTALPALCILYCASCTAHPVLRILYCASCTAHRNRVIRRISARAFREDGIVFQSIDEVNRYEVLLLLNKHGDLYFCCTILVYKLSALTLEKLQKKKIYLRKRERSTRSQLLKDANYDLKSNDSRRVQSRYQYGSVSVSKQLRTYPSPYPTMVNG